MFGEYDIIVVGAGHAGCEAACSAANLGSKTLLISMNMDYIAQMSCNPAIGGVAKGQIAREIDALGGYTGIVADKSMIQFRMLNRSKGPAMWSPRSQNDRMLFSTEWLRIIENTNNLDYISDNVKEVIIENNKAVGVKTIIGKTIKAKSIILCNGTFLNGKIYIGYDFCPNRFFIYDGFIILHNTKFRIINSRKFLNLDGTINYILLEVY